MFSLADEHGSASYLHLTQSGHPLGAQGSLGRHQSTSSAHAVLESSSPWSSPIVVVPIPVSLLRLCNDFRKLNEVAEFDSYPMLRVDKLIQRLGRACFISGPHEWVLAGAVSAISLCQGRLQYGAWALAILGPPLCIAQNTGNLPTAERRRTLAPPGLPR